MLSRSSEQPRALGQTMSQTMEKSSCICFVLPVFKTRNPLFSVQMRGFQLPCFFWFSLRHFSALFSICPEFRLRTISEGNTTIGGEWVQFATHLVCLILLRALIQVLMKPLMGWELWWLPNRSLCGGCLIETHWLFCLLVKQRNRQTLITIIYQPRWWFSNACVHKHVESTEQDSQSCEMPNFGKKFCWGAPMNTHDR